MTTTVQVIAKTERIVEPDVIDALLMMPFGVALSRRIQIDAAPVCPPQLRREAIHCLVVLCGGKDLVIETDGGERDYTITARVGVRAKNPPLECLMQFDGGRLLDVGKFLTYLQHRQYAVHEVRAALNGAQKHKSDAQAE